MAKNKFGKHTTYSVGLEQGSLSLVGIIEELLEWKS
jgi:hypothetical protein